MKRVFLVFVGLVVATGVVFLAVTLGGDTVRGQEEPTPTATLGPFTPTFWYTLDDAAPDNPDVAPAADECQVGAPCKSLWWMEIPDGQPSAGISGRVIPSSVADVAGGAVVPDGAITGKTFWSARSGPVGECATQGTIISAEWTDFDATMDASTTTGSPSDLYSFSHWPTQLNGIRDTFLATNPGSALIRRVVGWSPWWPVNTLYFSRTDGSIPYIVVGGDPTAPPAPPSTCGPVVAKAVLLGVSADNPDTSENEGGIPLRTCFAPGTFTVGVTLDREDTPPGDFVILEDTSACSPNTPVGSNVAVPLNGGTGTLAGIDLTFSQVTGAGSTSIITTTTGPVPPTGYKIVGLEELPLYFDISTDASYSGDVTVCLRYNGTQVTGPEAGLKLMHNVDQGFVDITTSVDTVGDIICGTTTHLSVFAVAEPAAIATPTSTSTPPPTPTRRPGVGGAVQLPLSAVAAESGASHKDSGWSAAGYAAFVGGLVVAVAVVGVGGWRVRKRRVG